MNREEALKFLLNEWNAADAAGRQAFVADIQRLAHPIQNHFYSLGFGAGKLEGKSERQGEFDTLTTRATTAEGNLATANTRIATLEQQKPDIAEITRNHQTEIQKLKDDQAKERTKLREDNERILVDGALAGYKAHLASLGIDERGLAGETALIRDRIKVIEGKPTLLMEGSTSTPLSVAEGQDPWKVEAERVAKLIDPKRVRSNGDRGAGDKQDNAGGGGGGSGNKYDRIRTEVSERSKNSVQPGDIFTRGRGSPVTDTSR